MCSLLATPINHTYSCPCAFCPCTQTSQILAGKGRQRMHATDLDTSIAYWHSSLKYNAAQAGGVCALKSSSYYKNLYVYIASLWIYARYITASTVTDTHCDMHSHTHMKYYNITAHAPRVLETFSSKTDNLSCFQFIFLILVPE